MEGFQTEQWFRVSGPNGVQLLLRASLPSLPISLVLCPGCPSDQAYMAGPSYHDSYPFCTDSLIRCAQTRGKASSPNSISTLQQCALHY
jgi:hypothetical protein